MTAALAMNMAHLDDRLATMMSRTLTTLEKASARTRQQNQEAKQLFHSILPVREPLKTITG